MIFFFYDRLENSVGKGENAGYQHFLLFPPCFQERPVQGLFGKELTLSQTSPCIYLSAVQVI